jgi:predicted esterase
MLATGPAAAADLLHESVEGPAVTQVAVQPPGANADTVAWDDLGAPRAPGLHALRFVATGRALRIPHCAGRGRVIVDGAVKDTGSKGPLVLRLETADGPTDAGDAGVGHEVRVEINVSTYERRIACGEPPRAGLPVPTRTGLVRIAFPSPNERAGGGEVVLFVPRGHDPEKPAALLVGLHPWNGGPWTYAAYRELIEQAQADDVVLAMPSGLGNSLYVEAAEDEVLRAIDEVKRSVAIDPRRVSLWGASMGGAGATTIGFHSPDRFAFVASYFGDSKYDLTTYVKSMLGGEAGARKVNALDVLENARHLPVWLIHGDADRSSPIAQSAMLDAAMKKAGFTVDFDRVPGAGHEGALVARYLRRVVSRAAAARAPVHPARVSYRSVRGVDVGAYGVRLVRAGERDAIIDLEKRDDAVHIHLARGVTQVVLTRGALGGATPGSPIVWHDAPEPRPFLTWDP